MPRRLYKLDHATARRNFRAQGNHGTLTAVADRNQSLGDAYLLRRVSAGPAYGLQEVPMKAHPPIGQSPLGLFRPVLWLAAAGFAAGFGGYMALGLRAIHPAG
jgi:hypothetical protein